MVDVRARPDNAAARNAERRGFKFSQLVPRGLSFCDKILELNDERYIAKDSDGDTETCTRK